MTTRLAALALLAVALACDTPGGAVAEGPDFTIGPLSWHAASGGALKSGTTMTLALSDQPDTCAAIQLVPARTITVFSLRVSPGDTHATVIPPGTEPTAGQAAGALVRSTNGVAQTRIDATSGTLSWTVNASGSVTLTAIDVGFSGTGDRLTSADLTLAACP